MMSAKILTYAVLDDETVADLQLRIEKDTNIPAANQELLLEAGLALEPHGPVTQCAIDYTVMTEINTLYSTQKIPPTNVMMHGVVLFVPFSRRWMDGERTCLWSSSLIAPVRFTNHSLLLELFLKMSTLSVSAIKCKLYMFGLIRSSF